METGEISALLAELMLRNGGYSEEDELEDEAECAEFWEGSENMI